MLFYLLEFTVLTAFYLESVFESVTLNNCALSGVKGFLARDVLEVCDNAYFYFLCVVLLNLGFFTGFSFFDVAALDLSFV